MASWKEIRSNVERVAKKTINKTEEIAENASMHVKLTTLNSKRDGLYEKLGKLTYKQLKSGVEKAEEIAKVIADIDKTLDDIAKQKAKIEEAKAKQAQEKQEKKEARAEAEAKKQAECVAEVQVIIDNSTEE